MKSGIEANQSSRMQRELTPAEFSELQSKFKNEKNQGIELQNRNVLNRPEIIISNASDGTGGSKESLDFNEEVIEEN